MRESATKKAVRLAGGPKAVAKAFRIKSLWSVYKWMYRDEVPPDRVLRLEELSGVSRFALRPDIYGKPNGKSV